MLGTDRLVAVAAREIEERRRRTVWQPLAQAFHQLADCNCVAASFIVFELQMSGTAMTGEMDSGRRLAPHGLNQIVDRSQFGWPQPAVLGQRACDPVALALVVQAAALGRRHVDDEMEVIARLLQHRAGTDDAKCGASKIDTRVADQKRFTVVQQLPRQGQQHVVVAAQCHERSRAAGSHVVSEPFSRRFGVEEHIEQNLAKGSRMSMQLGPIQIARHRLASHSVESEQRNAEAVAHFPRRRHRACVSGRIGDFEMIRLQSKHERQLLTDEQQPGVVVAEVTRATDHRRQLGRDTTYVAVSRVERMHVLQECRKVDRFERHDHDSSHGAVVGHERRPLLLDPPTSLRAC
ncbi:MAG TPA: hypothetical protein VGQ16_00145 [Vicinamibacterales bacterium]|nr:hypothetical protein [Vicinamibacterales bacterium]